MRECTVKNARRQVEGDGKGGQSSKLRTVKEQELCLIIIKKKKRKH